MTRLSKEHMTRFMPCVNVLVAQSCLSLHPMDCSLPGSSIHGISQQEYWSRLPFPSPKKTSKRLFLGAFLKILKKKRTLMPITRKLINKL